MQPEGLQESSRRSERSGDHRYRVSWNTHPERVLDIPCESLAPLQGAIQDLHMFPVVFATLRPPATFSQPFGLAFLLSQLN